jgi:hypothetical protein
MASMRLKEKPELAYWQDVITRVSNSPFCGGDNDRGWKANFEFLVRADTHLKVMEGVYGGKKAAGYDHIANWRPPDDA